MSAVWTLALDAATYGGTVAVFAGDRLVAERAVAMRGREEERLLPAVAAALGEAGVLPGALSRIVCGEGPGSFTSLRIAASIAKGLAVASGAPLHAVPSLVLVVAGLHPPGGGVYLVTLDAMRGERYALPVRVDGAGAILAGAQPELLAEHAVADRARALGARVAGPGCEVDAAPHARGALRALAAAGAAAPVDLDGWEPIYGRPAEAQARWEAAHGRPLPR